MLLYRPLQSATAAGGAEHGYQQLQALAHQDPAAGDPEALLAAAERAYQQDRGWGSVQAAFGPLDDLDPELGGDQPPPEPADAASEPRPAGPPAPRT